MMIRFVTLSFTLHLLAAGVFYYLLPPQAAAPAGALSVSLQTIDPAPARDIPPAPPAKTQGRASQPAPARQAGAPAASPPATVSATAAEPDQQAIATPVVAGPATEEIADTQQARAAEADMLDSLRSTLYRALHANFNYPRRARQRGWEGTVVISLRILADGKLTDIRVAGSSGISTLDRAAVASLSKVRVPQLVALMHGRALDMTIPVEYRLTDG